MTLSLKRVIAVATMASRGSPLPRVDDSLPLLNPTETRRYASGGILVFPFSQCIDPPAEAANIADFRIRTIDGARPKVILERTVDKQYWASVTVSKCANIGLNAFEFMQDLKEYAGRGVSKEDVVRHKNTLIAQAEADFNRSSGKKRRTNP